MAGYGFCEANPDGFFVTGPNPGECEIRIEDPRMMGLMYDVSHWQVTTDVFALQGCDERDGLEDHRVIWQIDDRYRMRCQLPDDEARGAPRPLLYSDAILEDGQGWMAAQHLMPWSLGAGFATGYTYRLMTGLQDVSRSGNYAVTVFSEIFEGIGGSRSGGDVPLRDGVIRIGGPDSLRTMVYALTIVRVAE